jgi:anti-sigma B factor antagonist
VTETTKGISVGCTTDEVYVQVVGRGTFQNSQPLHRFAQGMIDRGYRRITLDLGACTTMDSTFLGVLAGMGLRLRDPSAAPTGEVRIVNASRRSVELLETLGLDRLFAIRQLDSRTGPVPPPPNGLQRLPDSDVESDPRPSVKRDTTDLMLTAHTNLIRADQRNEGRFATVTRSLRESLERQQEHDPKP